MIQIGLSILKKTRPHRLFNSNGGFNWQGKRTFLSENYYCYDQWDKYLVSDIVKKVGPVNQYSVSVNDKLKNKSLVTPLDMDLLATKIIHVNNIQELEFIENIFINFRKTQPALFVRDSMHYSFVRNYIDLNQSERLLQILKLKYKYGIFLDAYTANMLMDYFVKNENYKNAALTAHEMMLQENNENELNLAACLLTCLKCLRSGVADENEESNIEDKQETKEKRLVYFLRKEFNDEHFDLKSISKLCGKTIYFSSNNLKMDDQNLNKNMILYGLVQYGKYDKAVEFLENSLIKNNETTYEFIIDDFKKAIESLIANEEESKKSSDIIQKWNHLSQVLDSESSKFISRTNVDSVIQKIEDALNRINEHQTKKDVEIQNELFVKWNREQENELNQQIKNFTIEQKKKNILKRLDELEKQEEIITFFEKRQEIIDAYYGKGFPTEYPSDIPIEPEESIFKAKFERHFKPWPKYMNRPKSSYGISKSRASKLDSLKKIYLNDSNQPQGNVSTIIDETIIYENEVESKKTLEYSPIKLEARHSLLPIKKQTKTIEYDDEDSNISKLPILVFTPEKNPHKFTSTFADQPPIESFMTEDLTVNSPSISSINYVNSQLTDSLITNDSTIIGTEFAYSNILYCSPELNKQSSNSNSLITEDLTYFSSIYSKSLASNTTNFKTVSSKNFFSMKNNSGEILV